MIINGMRWRMRHALTAAALTQLRGRSSSSNRHMQDKVLFVSIIDGDYEMYNHLHNASCCGRSDIVLVVFRRKEPGEAPDHFRFIKWAPDGPDLSDRCALWAPSEKGPAIIIDLRSKKAFVHDRTKLCRVIDGPTHDLEPGIAAARQHLAKFATEIPEEAVSRFARQNQLAACAMLRNRDLEDDHETVALFRKSLSRQ